MKKYYFTHEEMKQLSQAWNTSPEIASIICSYRATEKGRDRVWQNPTEKEFKMICKKAAKNPDIKEYDCGALFWGAETIKLDNNYNPIFK